LDVVFGSSRTRLESDDFLGDSSSGLGGGVGSVGSVKHSSSGSLGDSTVDVSCDINGTSDSEFFGTSSGSWLLDEFDSSLSNGSSFSGHGTKFGLGDSINGSKGSSTGSRSNSSGVIDLSGEWIRLNDEVEDPFSLSWGSSSIKDSLGGVGSVGSVGFGSWGWGGWGGWERWRWVTEVSTISISDSSVWNSHRFGEFTTNIKNQSVISDITDSLLIGKSKRNWFTSIISSSHVDSSSRGEEPTFNRLTVKSGSVFTLRGRGKVASGFLTSSSNSSIAPLWFSMSTFKSSNEFTMGSLDTFNITHNCGC
jgi:hypothetical protein